MNKLTMKFKYILQCMYTSVNIIIAYMLCYVMLFCCNTQSVICDHFPTAYLFPFNLIILISHDGASNTF